MERSNKILSASIYYIVCSFLLRGINLITTPFFARILTQEEYGYASNFSSWMSIVLAIVSLSLIASLIRAWFEFEKDIYSYIFSILILGLLSTVIAFSIILIQVDYFEKLFSLDRKYVILMGICIASEPAYSIFLQHQRYEYKYKIVTMLTVLITVCNVGISFLFIYLFDDNLWGKVLGGNLPSIIIAIGIYIYYFIKGKNIKLSYWKYAFLISFPYIFHILSSTVLTSSDRTMITKFCGATENALYSMAYNIAMIVNMLWQAFNQAFSPWLGEKLNKKKYELIPKVSLIYLGVFTYIIVGLMLLAPNVLLIFGGNKYTEAKYLIPPIMLSYLIVAIDTMYVNIEQYEKKTLGMAIATITSAVTNVLLNYLFIPCFGYVVAAYTTLVSYLLLLIINYHVVKKINMHKIYNTKIFMSIIVSMFAFSMISVLLYTNYILQYIFCVVYILLTLIVIVKYRVKIKKFLIEKGEDDICNKKV